MLHQYVSGNFPTFGGTGRPKLQPPPRRQSGAAARQIKATAKINTANRPWRPTGSLSASGSDVAQAARCRRRDPWIKVAEFASYSCQIHALNLKPWQSPHCCVGCCARVSAVLILIR